MATPEDFLINFSRIFRQGISTGVVPADDLVEWILEAPEPYKAWAWDALTLPGWLDSWHLCEILERAPEPYGNHGTYPWRLSARSGPRYHGSAQHFATGLSVSRSVRERTQEKAAVAYMESRELSCSPGFPAICYIYGLCKALPCFPYPRN